MSRRPDPERLYTASRTATLNRLIGDGELPERAEHWLVRWEAMADSESRPRDGGYWDAGYRWIQSHIQKAEVEHDGSLGIPGAQHTDGTEDREQLRRLPMA